jgi:hypothetical protein
MTPWRFEGGSALKAFENRESFLRRSGRYFFLGAAGAGAGCGGVGGADVGLPAGGEAAVVGSDGCASGLIQQA